MKSIPYYLEKVITQFGTDDGAIEILKLGKVVDTYNYNIDLNTGIIDEEDQLRIDLEDLFEFVRMAYMYIGIRPFWLKINIDHTSKSEIVGSGFIERFNMWFDLVIKYLTLDRLNEDGDSTFYMIDLEFKWAISIQLSKENEEIIISLVKKQS